MAAAALIERAVWIKREQLLQEKLNSLSGQLHELPKDIK